MDETVGRVEAERALVDEEAARLDVAHARDAYRWLVAMLFAVLVLPPFAVSLTETRSAVSPGLAFAVLYLPWRTLRLRGRLAAAGTAYGIVTTAILGYFVLHALYYLAAEHSWFVFTLEAQWAVYFAAFACVLFDVQPLADARAKIVRVLLLAILCQAVLGIVSAFTGPLVDVGAWTGGRFGLDIERATGTFGTPNGFAGVMAIGGVLALCHGREGLPLPRAVLLPPILTALFLAQSKSGWLSFAMSALLVTLLRFLFTGAARGFVLALVLGTVLVAAASMPGVVGELSTDYGDRITFGERVLQRFEDSGVPYQLFGLGFRQTAVLDPETHAWVTAHNSYVSFLAEIGAIGLLLVVALWGLSLWTMLRARDWALVGALSCMLLHLYSETFLYGNVYVLFSVLFLALPRMPVRASEAAAPFTPQPA